MTARQKTAMEPIADEAHFQVLRVLHANPQTSQRKLAASVGISLGKANYCLQELVGKGLVKARNFRDRKNKMVYAYLLTPAGIAAKAALTAQFLRRKTAEFEALSYEIEELRRESR